MSKLFYVPTHAGNVKAYDQRCDLHDWVFRETIGTVVLSGDPSLLCVGEGGPETEERHLKLWLSSILWIQKQPHCFVVVAYFTALPVCKLSHEKEAGNFSPGTAHLLDAFVPKMDAFASHLGYVAAIVMHLFSKGTWGVVQMPDDNGYLREK